MSTEAKKWTQEELEAFLQGQEEQEWEDEWVASPPGEDEEEWADEELALERKRRQIQESLRRDKVKFYEEEGFQLGKGGKLLEEFRAWLPGKKNEWCKIRDQQPKEECEALREMRARKEGIEASMDILEQKDRENWTIDDYYEWDGDREVLCELRRDIRDLEMSDDWNDKRDMDEWLIEEWNRYLETKELMLRKTRSKDVTGTIMSFC